MDFTVERGGNAGQVLGAHSAEPNGHPECGSHSGARWYCVQTVRGRESEVRDRLEAQGFGTFLPLVQVARDGKAVMEVAFPSYAFVRFDVAAQQWRCIHSTRGVRRLFSTAPERPTPMRDAAFARLLAEGIAKPLTDDLPAKLYQAGVMLRVADGASPWCDKQGMCLWSDGERVTLMMQLFGRDTPLTLHRRQVSLVAG
jgi:transcription antitermination factor NusG